MSVRCYRIESPTAPRQPASPGGAISGRYAVGKRGTPAVDVLDVYQDRNGRTLFKPVRGVRPRISATAEMTAMWPALRDAFRVRGI